MSKQLTMPTLGEILESCEQVGACLEWSRLYSTNGYPMLSIGRHRRLHLRRVVFNMERERTLLAPLGGPSESRKRIVMTCDNRRCVNPAHMEASTEPVIQKAAAQRGSYSSPSRRAAVTAGIRAKRGNLKCSLAMAREIRESTDCYRVLAERHGLCKAMVGRIKRGELWREATLGSSVFNLA